MHTMPPVMVVGSVKPSRSAWRSPWPWIGIATAVVVVPITAIVVALAFAAESGARSSAANKRPAGPSVNAQVLVMDGTVRVENAGTNSWKGAVVTLDPLGGRYQLRIAGFAPNQGGEFPLNQFTRSNGERFPSDQRVPTMVMVEADGLEASVRRTR